jgi:hypothetical protein
LSDAGLGVPRGWNGASGYDVVGLTPARQLPMCLPPLIPITLRPASSLRRLPQIRSSPSSAKILSFASARHDHVSPGGSDGYVALVSIDSRSLPPRTHVIAVRAWSRISFTKPKRVSTMRRMKARPAEKH